MATMTSHKALQMSCYCHPLSASVYVCPRLNEGFSTRRAERDGGKTADNQRLAQHAALMTRAAKRDVDRGALGQSWERQAASGPPPTLASEAVDWAVAHLSGRETARSGAAPCRCAPAPSTRR